MQFPIALMQTSVSSPEPLKKTNTLKRIDANKSRRREQCRANQARYRDRQRNAQRQLEKCVEQLHNDLATLKHRYRDLSSRERSNQSPWTIVAEVFRLIEASFRMPWGLDLDRESHQIEAILERAFAHDAAMGELRNVDALMEQLRLFSQYFGDPELQLQRIENVAPGVMAARAKLSVTVTKLTLCHVFSRLETTTGTVDTYEYLRQQLFGQRLHCNSSMNFLFDEENERVVRLETTIDLVTPLLQVFGSLKDVAVVLQDARISSECVIDHDCRHVRDPTAPQRERSWGMFRNVARSRSRSVVVAAEWACCVASLLSVYGPFVANYLVVQCVVGFEVHSHYRFGKKVRV